MLRREGRADVARCHQQDGPHGECGGCYPVPSRLLCLGTLDLSLSPRIPRNPSSLSAREIQFVIFFVCVCGG